MLPVIHNKLILIPKYKHYLLKKNLKIVIVGNIGMASGDTCILPYQDSICWITAPL